MRRLLDPTLQALRAIPSIAWVPLFILWLGIFEASKVALIAVGVFFPVYLGIAGAILSVDRKLVEVGHVFRLSRVQLARRILLPAVLPEAVIALRSGLGLGFMFVVAAEFMGASEGLGYLLVDGQQMGKPDQILAAIIAFALLGKTADSLLVAATKPLVRWQDTVRESACDAEPRTPLQDLCRRHAGARPTSISPCSEGEIVALIGGSGCGKTTFCASSPASTGRAPARSASTARCIVEPASGRRHRVPGAAPAALADRSPTTSPSASTA